jgi:cell division protein FtsZ
VLKNAVGGIAEIITYPGLVNVDFEDVRTVMGEMGRAMMGSAAAAGVDRARIAAEQAVASPLLEGVNLSGAKGVLVNITAARGGLKMKEVNEVMNTVKAFAADDAHIIFGAVYDELMGDALRVTVVATGLGQVATARVRQPEAYAQPVLVQATGTSDAVAFQPSAAIDYSHLEVPSVVRRGARNVTVEALANSGVDRYDIPAFLRKQAD